MNKKIKILYVSAELSPYASAGGLGEAGNGFTGAIKEYAGIEIRRVLPLHKGIRKNLGYLSDFPVRMEQGYDSCIVKTDSDNGEMTTYFLGNDRYFYREHIYGYEDDPVRFFFFCRAVAELLKVLDYKPDIIHCNDWHTGFLPVFIRKEFPGIRTVFTIHNLSYQGFIPGSYLLEVLSEKEQKLLDYPNWLNFMKAGILYSDRLTTVSPGYCEEILNPEFSCGMSSLFDLRQDRPEGILNGIDTLLYDPSREDDIAYPYDFSSYENKAKNRTLLRKKYGLPETDAPLAVMVTRLEYSKGIDLVIKLLHLMKPGICQLVILGSGNPYYQGILSCAAQMYPDTFAADFEYTSAKARNIYAAGDICLMPSQFEPCGLGQLYAMRYGAVPVVNPVGGLKCTVTDEKEDPENATGFYMEEWSAEALLHTLERAVRRYHTSAWINYVKNAMERDFSWKNSISEYKKLYEGLLK